MIKFNSCLRCASFPGSIGFPTQRLNETNNFVASVVIENHKQEKICPRTCRRKGHEEDWIYC